MFKRSLSAPAPAPAPALQQIHPLRQIVLPIDTRTSYPGPMTRESTYTEPVRRDVNNPSTNTYQPPVRRDTISLPLPVTPYTPVPMHSLSWQQEEDRRRMEVAREHGYWWTGLAEEDDDDMYETYPAPTREPGAGEAYQMGVEGMGYDDNAAAAAFDQAYLDVSPPFLHVSYHPNRAMLTLCRISPRPASSRTDRDRGDGLSSLAAKA
jgi:hypothetical protein